MNKKILCVDDDPNILQDYQRAFRKDFNIVIAEGGEQGLATLAKEGPFAVIVADMRMPKMDGLQFLISVKDLVPDSVRVMLTGNSDQQTAMEAVNQGRIFRFLTKPCPREVLSQTLTAGVEHYRLVTAEKQLLEETLNNSLQVLIDMLSLVNPTAFTRSTRVKRLVREIAVQLGLRNPWEVEIAATLSQIGCITVPEETLLKIANGEAITGKELSLYQQHPQVAHDLVARIPRLQAVAQIIAHQNRRMSDETGSKTPASLVDSATMGARILKAVLDFDKLLQNHLSPDAIRELAERQGWYDPLVLQTLKDIIHQNVEEYRSITLSLAELQPGMFLADALQTTHGTLLLACGQEITMSLILRLRSFAETNLIPQEIQVRVPINDRPRAETAHLA